MAKITEKDYETVEKTVTKYKCDHCGVVTDEDIFFTVVVTKRKRGIITDDDVIEAFDHCEDCVGLPPKKKINHHTKKRVGLRGNLLNDKTDDFKVITSTPFFIGGLLVAAYVGSVSIAVLTFFLTIFLIIA